MSSLYFGEYRNNYVNIMQVCQVSSADGRVTRLEWLVNNTNKIFTPNQGSRDGENTEQLYIFTYLTI